MGLGTIALMAVAKPLPATRIVKTVNTWKKKIVAIDGRLNSQKVIQENSTETMSRKGQVTTALLINSRHENWFVIICISYGKGREGEGPSLT